MTPFGREAQVGVEVPADQLAAGKSVFLYCINYAREGHGSLILTDNRRSIPKTCVILIFSEDYVPDACFDMSCHFGKYY